MVDIHDKYAELKRIIKEMGSLAVAFSGGVDSTFLMKVARDTLGDRAIAVTASAPSFPESEMEEAASFCRSEGIRQIVANFDPFSVEGFRSNPENRCYICKKALFTQLIQKAEGITNIAEGSNMDDNSDYRPGMLAIAELGIKSPLRAAGLYKTEIRTLSRELGLPTYCKPSMACLATRFVYGDTITEEKLHMVEQGEDFLRSLGFRQVRVRIHDRLARIEIAPEEFDIIMQEDMRRRISETLRNYGFDYVSLDLMGYRTGSMNETLPEDVLALGRRAD